MGSIKVRNSLLSKRLKRTEIRLLIIDDNQLRYNQILNLLSGNDYQVNALLLDDLKVLKSVSIHLGMSLFLVAPMI